MSAPSVDVARLRATLAAEHGGPVELRQTHCSIVLLAGDRAYKLKRAVRYDFVDQSSPELRAAACRHEAEINEPLAAGLVLGVRAIVPAGEGYELAPDGASGAVDSVIVMRRFDEARTLRALVDAGGRSARLARAAGERLARFHAEARVAPEGADYGALWQENLIELTETLTDKGMGVDGLRRFGEAFVHARGEQLAARAVAKCVVDGHGDVRAEHVLDDESGVMIVDRLEIDRLRVVDVADDVGFLLCDLEHLGAGELGAEVLEGYAGSGGRELPARLLAFFGSYRAQVRAKVALLRDDRVDAVALLALARRLAWRARGPLTLLVGGPPASGTSTLARALAEASGLPVLSSDAVRPSRCYSDAARAAVYEELGRRAGDAGSSIVDATFGDARLRAAFAAAGPSNGVVSIDCHAPRELRLARAGRRAAAGASLSDAGPREAALLGDRHDPAPDALVVDTRAPIADQVDAVEADLDRRLAAGGR